MKKLIVVSMVLGLIAIPALAAPTVDLTFVGAPAGTVTGSVGGTAIFQQWVLGPSTGSGEYDPYVRIGATGNNTSERGYNTGLEFSHVGGEEFDTKDTGGTRFDHALLLSTIPVVQDPAGISGTFREFTLDLNQSNSTGGVFLSLDALKVYQSNSSNLTGWPAGFPAPIWDMGDNWVALSGDNLLDNGSGKGDILVYIPDSLFTGDQFVYMYTQYGLQTDTSLAINPDGIWGANDGFEEWGVRIGGTPPVVPAPGAMLLGSIGVGIVGWLRTRRSL